MTRLLRIQKAFNGVRIFYKVLLDKWKELFGSILICVAMIIAFATIMWLIEGPGQPNGFGSIPRALYFAVVTFGTVGFGDFTASTWYGRAVTSIFILFPVSLFGITITIFASSALEEIHKSQEENSKILDAENRKLKERVGKILRLKKPKVEVEEPDRGMEWNLNEKIEQLQKTEKTACPNCQTKIHD